MFKIFVTSKVPEKVLSQLQDNFTLNYNNSEIPLTKKELITGAQGCHAILCPLSDKIDAEIMDANPQLKIIANFGAGFDNIDLDHAKKNNIIVTNAPAKSSAVSTAEFTFGLILSLARKIVSGDKLSRRGEFISWRPTFYLGHELRGKTLGIIGLGNIGKNLAKRALAFEMKVIYWNRTKFSQDDLPGIMEYVELDELFAQSDFISLHTAFAKELHHLINSESLKKMKSSAYLINAARGPLLCESDLIVALKNGTISGAALDVYEFEPKISSELMEMDNVILAPHLGNATFEARNEMGLIAFSNILALSRGESPPNRVN